MYRIEKFRVELVDSYQHMTFPGLQYLLEKTETEIAIFAYTITYMNQPIGLCIGEINQQKESAEVLSLFVEPTHRNRGVATQLLQYIESEMKARGCQHMSINYLSGKPTTASLERVLQKCLWAEPHVHEIICKGHIYNGIKMPWVKKEGYFVNSYEIFPWSSITNEEIMSIQERKDNIPQDLYPLQYMANMEGVNSIGLRYRGDVVGWLISHRIAPDTIRFTCSYIRQDLQKIGRNLGLMAEAIKRQYQARVPYIIWTTPMHHQGMVEFTKKRISPFLIYLKEFKKSHRFLLVL
jgi:GNAT superfamily N-acetyltransferase